MTSILTQYPIEDAYYSSDEFNNIHVELRDPSSAGNNIVVIPYNLEPKDGDEDYEALKSAGWDNERLLQSTADYKRSQGAQIMNIIDGEVSFRVSKIVEATKANMDMKAAQELNLAIEDLAENFVKNLVSTNTDVDYLFKVKLAVFALDPVKNASADLKRKIRKSKSVIETVALLKDIYSDVENK